MTNLALKDHWSRCLFHFNLWKFSTTVTCDTFNTLKSRKKEGHTRTHFQAFTHVQSLIQRLTSFGMCECVFVLENVWYAVTLQIYTRAHTLTHKQVYVECMCSFKIAYFWDALGRARIRFWKILNLYLHTCVCVFEYTSCLWTCSDECVCYSICMNLCVFVCVQTCVLKANAILFYAFS